MKKKIIISALSCLLGLLAVGGGVFALMYHLGMTDIQTNPKIIKDKSSLMCIGDSVTYGYGISDRRTRSYPAVLNELFGDTATVLSYAVSGSTAQDTGDQPFTATPAYRASLDTLEKEKIDKVIIMLGSNDSKPENWQGSEQFISYYDKLVGKYKKEGTKIYLCTPPAAFPVNSSHITSFDIDTDRVAEIGELIRSYSEQQGLELIDVYSFTVGHRELFQRDAVHPSAEGAAQLAQFIYNEIK